MSGRGPTGPAVAVNGFGPTGPGVAVAVSEFGLTDTSPAP